MSDPVATFNERFAVYFGTLLEVQATGITGVTDIEVTGVKMLNTATSPKRVAVITLTIDSEDYEIDLDFADEAFNLVGLKGEKLNAPAPV